MTDTKSNAMAERPFLTIREAARLANVCERTVQRWCYQQRFPSRRPIDRGSSRRLIDRAAFQRFLGGEVAAQ